MDTVTLETVLECPDLPSLPKIAIDLVELTRDPDADVAEIARIVQYDQALTAKVLRTVNSSYYGLVHPCTSLRRATAYLGINAVRSIVLGFSLVDMTRRGGKGLDLLGYWQRCIYSAAAARRIATRTTQCDPEEAFVAALMQDVGMLTMHTAVSQIYDDIVGLTRGDHRLLPQCETRRLGFTHADAGAGLCERWRLPARIIEPIRLHHRGDTDGPDETTGIVRTVSMSYRIATAIGQAEGQEELRTAYGMGDRYFGFSIDDVQSLLADASDDAMALSRLFEVKIGRKADIDRVLNEARTVIDQHRPVGAPEITTIAAAFTEDELIVDLEDAISDATETGEDVGLMLVMLDPCEALDRPAPVVDAALSEIRTRLSRFAGSRVRVHRTGARTLGIIVPDADRARVARVGEGIRARVAMGPFTLPSADDRPLHPERITVSVGVASFDPTTRDVFHRPEVLSAAAARALEKARETGNTVEAFVAGARAA